MRRRRFKTRKNGILKFALFALIVFAVFTLGHFIYGFLLSWDKLNVRKIEVRGAKVLGPDRVKSFLNQRAGKNIFTYKLDGKKVAREKWIKKAEIVRDFPDRIVVKIRERTPLAVFARQGREFVISADGWILDKASLAKKIYKLPFFPDYGKISAEKRKQARDFLRHLRRKEVDFYRSAKKFSYSGDSLKMILDGFTVYFGKISPDLANSKIQAVKKIIADAGKKGVGIEYLDLRPFTRKTQSAIIKTKKLPKGSLKKENGI